MALFSPTPSLDFRHIDRVLPGDLIFWAVLQKKGSDLPVTPGLLGGLKGLYFPAGSKTPGHNQLENQITSKSPAKPPRSLKSAALGPALP